MSEFSELFKEFMSKNDWSHRWSEMQDWKQVCADCKCVRMYDSNLRAFTYMASHEHTFKKSLLTCEELLVMNVLIE